jgi:hypothetical protein
MKVKPPIWTFDLEDHIKVLQSARHEQHSLAAFEPAAGGDQRLSDGAKQAKSWIPGNPVEP